MVDIQSATAEIRR